MSCSFSCASSPPPTTPSPQEPQCSLLLPGDLLLSPRWLGRHPLPTEGAAWTLSETRSVLTGSAVGGAGARRLPAGRTLLLSCGLAAGPFTGPSLLPDPCSTLLHNFGGLFQPCDLDKNTSITKTDPRMLVFVPLASTLPPGAQSSPSHGDDGQHIPAGAHGFVWLAAVQKTLSLNSDDKKA